uniref:Cadherin-1 n=1 Tax=Salmo trutta TaxID=8032 RepID=A0A674EMI0_SALTR
MGASWFLELGVLILFLQAFKPGLSEESKCAPGFNSEMYIFKVERNHLQSGRSLGKVVFDDCTSHTSFLFHSEDSHFKVDGDGTLKLERGLTLHNGHKEFYVSTQSKGKKITVPVRVLHEARHGHHHNHHEMTTQPKPGGSLSLPVLNFPKSSGGLKRRKRDWVIPPINFPENDRGPFPQIMVQIRSNNDKGAKIQYSLTGTGADLPPVGLFTVDSNSGILSVTQPLDREKKDKYILLAQAVAVGAGIAESPIEIIVKVIDMNDNKPVFTQDPFMGTVPEASKPGDEVMRITALDADEEGSANSDVRYTILSQEPPLPSPNMFVINSVTGGIRVNAPGLDREKIPKYTLAIRAADMEGNGLTSVGKAIITVTDSNDNGDEPHSSTCSTTYKIVDGDPQGLFSLSTGPSKLEGIITTAKPGGSLSLPVLNFPKSSGGLKRRKRDWVIPPINFPENDRGPFPQIMVQIRSNNDKEVKIQYSITGTGADLPPVGIFTVDKNSGNLYVTEPLDREKKDKYILLAHAVAVGAGVAEDPMEIIVKVIDMNDNKPVFTQDPFMGTVPEASKPGDEVMQVTATDADEEGSANSDVRYTILSQEPPLPSPNMFVINSVTGGIRVNAPGLDREKIPKYTLAIQAADMEGNGLTSFGKAIITVTDSNDNAPQFVTPSYTVSVPENKVDALVVKMPVTDGDEPHSSAWATTYKIVDGDPQGLFNVSTGPSKLEGVITTAKPLDFEKNNKYTLLVTVQNEVPFAISMPTSTATVVVNVEDVNEAPVFTPVEKIIRKPEDLPVDSDLVRYTATDPDTARNQEVTYKIRNDHAGWLSINKDTGLIKVKSLMDRESTFVQDNKYSVIVLGIDNDEIPATGTGTLIIELEDVNDNAPTIDETVIRVCNKESSPQLLSVTDKDGAGFTAPYTVQLQGSSHSNWTARMNDTKTGIILTLKTMLDSGDYTVVLRVSDNQGLHHDSTIQASVCDCKGADVQCTDKAVAGFGISSILGILGAVLLLLLLSLLLLMFLRKRGGEKKEPLLQEDDVRDNIYYYDEEGGGEDDQDFDLSVLHRGLDNRPDVFRNDIAPTMARPEYRPRPANPADIGNFIDDNLKAADNDPTAPPYDSLLVFDYEGGGSEAGSLSSLNSSSSGDDQDYDLLQEWGPRFKKLSDMYGGGED